MPYADPAKQREFQRQWFRKRAAELKDGQSCAQCGSTENLHLHHTNKLLKITHHIAGRCREFQARERSISVYLCAACHIELHAAEKRKPITHGTNAGYGRGCRCLDCKSAHREYEHNRRARRLAPIAVDWPVLVQSVSQ